MGDDSSFIFPDEDAGDSWLALCRVELHSNDPPPGYGDGGPDDESTGSSDTITMTAATPARSGVSPSGAQPPACASPSSSPRLPSPPPYTEVQIGPKSPTIGEAGQEMPLGESLKIDAQATRRIRPGTKAADMATGPPLVSLEEVCCSVSLPTHGDAITLPQLDSSFQLQEYLKSLHHHLRRDRATGNIKPIVRDTALTIANPPPSSDPANAVDRHIWLYELCRLLIIQTNSIIVGLFADSPPCSAQTCPEMRASEWQYLCAVHDPPKSCCAIDYCCHTLNWAGDVLTSPKLFPSRAIPGGGDGGNVAQGMRNLTNIMRRVYRIFAHAWFQHRGVFWQVENTEGVYTLFKTVCDVYQLIPEDNYTIPKEAQHGNEMAENEEQLETPVSQASAGGESEGPSEGVQILKREESGGEADAQPEPQSPDQGGEATTTVSVGATTRRHKHTPSTGSSVATIMEGGEEEEKEEGGKTEGDKVEGDKAEGDKAESDKAESAGAGGSVADDENPEEVESEEQAPTPMAEVADPMEKLKIEPTPEG